MGQIGRAFGQRQDGVCPGMKEREMVFDFLRKAPVQAVPERKASAVGRVIAWGPRGALPGARATRSA